MLSQPPGTTKRAKIAIKISSRDKKNIRPEKPLHRPRPILHNSHKMDAHALLTSQGWRGTGNSLHPTSNSIGLSRPLLVSKKADNLGIGKKQHRTSDMWWMNAFDSSLKGLDTSKEGQVIQTVTSGGLDMVQKGGAKWVGSKGGLYASFVRGEVLGGTLEDESESGKDGEVKGEGKKRKRGEDKESKEERRRWKELRRKARAERREEAVMEESVAGKKEESETKEERKARRAAKRAVKEKKAAEREDDIEMKNATKPGTKEERKEQRRLKRLARETKRAEAEPTSENPKKKRRKD